MAMEFTGIQDRSLIIQALKAKNNNVEAVMNEYFDSPEKFNSRYNWDESAFASNREGDEPSGTSSGPSEHLDFGYLGFLPSSRADNEP